MAGLASINIKFSADLAQFSTQMQNASRKISKMGKNMQRLGSQLSVGVTAPFVAFSAVALKNFDKQDKAVAQVNSGLKSTGRFTQELSDKLQKQASILQENSLFGDEEILQGATAQILSFTNISTDKIGRVNQVVADLSTRLKVDLKSSSIQVGKALNDPIANLSALSRSGIQFSEEQKKVINSLVKTNQLAKAQEIILGELENQYGGSAKAAAEAGTGWMKQLSNEIGDLTEDFGKHINKALKPFGKWVREVVKRIKQWSPETKKMALVIGGLSAVLGPLLVTLGLLMTNVIPGLITAFGYLRASLLLVQSGFLKLTALMVANPFGALAIAIAGIVAYFALFRSETEKVVFSQSLLSEVNETAAKSISKEKAKLAELLFVARNENIVKSARIKAVKELNKLSPKYLGDLTLETINTNSATDALKKYNDELLRSAKVKAAQKKLEELQSKIIDIQLRQENASVETAKEKSKIISNNNISYGGQQKLLSAINSAQKLGLKLSGNELISLKQQEQQLLKIISANQVLNTVVAKKDTPVVGRKKAASVNAGLTASGVKESGLGIADAVASENQELDTNLQSVNDSLINFSEQSSEILTATANNVVAGFGEIIGGLLSGTVSLGDVGGLLLSTIGEMAVSLGKAAVKIGIGMLAVKAAFTNPFGAIAAGVALIAIGKAMSGLATNFSSGNSGGSSPRPFANGGIVYGPTNALIGEYAGARSNPEVVAPLDKLKSLITPNSQALEIMLGGKITADAGRLQVLLDGYNAKKQRRT